jgi:hypothetical protein
VIIVDPVVLGDVPFTRASPKWVYDRTGTLVEVPANTLGVTYDPADLSRAPWALLEPEATNRTRNSTMQGAAVGFPGALPTTWEDAIIGGLSRQIVGVTKEAGIDCIDIRIFGTISGAASPEYTVIFGSGTATAAGVGEKWVSSAFIRTSAGTLSGITAAEHFVLGFNSSGGLSEARSKYFTPSAGPLNENRNVFEHTTAASSTVTIVNRIDLNFGAVGTAVDVTLRIGLPQFERDRLSSPIKTSNGVATRAADVVGAGAGLVYSNVPMVEPPYNVATTYAKDAAVYDPTTKIVYWSMVAGNVGKALSDPAFWNKRTAINRWAMFDDRNSTQTSNPEEIISVFSAKAITQGLFVGAADASEVRVSMTHPIRGRVFGEEKNLVLPRSGSSFYGWCFNRLLLRTWFLTLNLPVFANAVITVTILKPGGTPRCGMCLIGPVVDAGLSMMGLATELKDYSSTKLFVDGSSSTIERGYSKNMSVDVSVDSDRVETLEDYLIKRRQKTLVFLGSTLRGDTMLVGKFKSLRKIIDSFPRSKMALQIESVLSQ